MKNSVVRKSMAAVGLTALLAALSVSLLTAKDGISSARTRGDSQPELAVPQAQLKPILLAKAEDDEATSPLVGKAARPIKLSLLDGTEFDASAFQKKNILLVDFWATWCGPCRMAMPALVDVAKEYKDKGVLYFAVNLREDADTVKKYLAKEKLDIQVPLDKEGKVAQDYLVKGIPTMVVIDKEGIVRQVHVGYTPNLKAELKKILDSIIGDKKAAASHSELKG
jgi:thiol-disulfide isomerase/thioredoxin